MAQRASRIDFSKNLRVTRCCGFVLSVAKESSFWIATYLALTKCSENAGNGIGMGPSVKLVSFTNPLAASEAGNLSSVKHALGVLE